MKRSPRRLIPPNHTHAIALALAGAVLLVPANFLPVITTRASGDTRTDTIYSSIIGLWEQDMWAIGGIVFVASILVPLLKLIGLGWLLWAARGHARGHPRALTAWYARLDFIGRWSMLDVFLVAFLSGAVQFGALATIQPRIGIVAFAASVVLTMLATHALDPRVFWERPGSVERPPALPAP